MTEETVKCTSCYMEMSGEDDVVVDSDGRPFCSDDCYLICNEYYNMMSAREFIARKEKEEEEE